MGSPEAGHVPSWSRQGWDLNYEIHHRQQPNTDIQMWGQIVVIFNLCDSTWAKKSLPCKTLSTAANGIQQQAVFSAIALVHALIYAAV